MLIAHMLHASMHFTIHMYFLFIVTLVSPHSVVLMILWNNPLTRYLTLQWRLGDAYKHLDQIAMVGVSSFKAFWGPLRFWGFSAGSWLVRWSEKRCYFQSQHIEVLLVFAGTVVDFSGFDVFYWGPWEAFCNTSRRLVLTWRAMCVRLGG